MARLTDQQRKKLPPELRVILERFHHEPQLLMKLKQYLSLAAQKVVQHSINHDTFCDRFQIPQKLPNELLKLYGLTSKELKNALRKVGFDERNRMYDSTYYQTFVIAYLIGLEFDDENIRKMALLMIAILIWNGRKYKSFPSHCDPDIARYVLNYVLQGNHTLKKAGSAFEYIDQYSIPQIDKKYAPTIANNLNDDREGLRKLIETIWSRYEQLFRSMRNAYYKSHKEGKKEIISDKYSQQYGNGDMVESKESFSGNIERIIDKIEKNSMLKRNILLKPESQKIFKDKFNISQDGIRKINDWIEDDDNQEELHYFFELVFATLKPKSEMDICQYNIPALATKVTSSKKDPNLVKAKEILDHVLEELLGQKFKSYGYQSIARFRLVVAYSFMIYAKVMLCKKI
jgi:hypothetical protein